MSTAPATVRLVADPYPPYQHVRDGELSGYDHDLVSAAFAAAGLAAETELMAWEECLEALREGRADAIFQITPTAERQTWMAFSAPFRQARSVLYCRRGGVPEGFDGNLEKVVTGRRLGVLAGFSYGAAVDALPHKTDFASDGELLEALGAGVVDLAVIDEGVAGFLNGDDAELEPVPGFAETRPLHVGSTRERDGVVRAFDRGLRKLGDEVIAGA